MNNQNFSLPYLIIRKTNDLLLSLKSCGIQRKTWHIASIANTNKTRCPNKGPRNDLSFTVKKQMMELT